MNNHKETTPGAPSRMVYTNNDIVKMFGVSARTVSRWRNEGLLGFTHVGDKYFYLEDDITQFLSRNHEAAFA